MQEPGAMTTPAQSADDITRQREHFETVADDYVKGRQSPNHLIYKEIMWEDFFSGVRSLFPSGRIKLLEAMCGYSEGLALLEKHITRDVEYTGFDYSETMVAYGKKLHPTANIFVQDVTTYQPDKQYDVVILFSGLHHVHRHTEEVLRKLRQALVPGGLFISLEPTSNNIFMKWVGDLVYLKHRFFDSQTEKRYTLKELNACFTGSGFTIVKQTFPGLLPYVLYYNPGIFPMLDRGKPGFVRWLTNAERPLWNNWVGRYFSFAAITLCQNPKT